MLKVHKHIPDDLYGDDLGNKDKVEFVIGTLYCTEHPWFWRVHIIALISLGKNIKLNTRYSTACFEFARFKEFAFIAR